MNKNLIMIGGIVCLLLVSGYVSLLIDEDIGSHRHQSIQVDAMMRRIEVLVDQEQNIHIIWLDRETTNSSCIHYHRFDQSGDRILNASIPWNRNHSYPSAILDGNEDLNIISHRSWITISENGSIIRNVPMNHSGPNYLVKFSSEAFFCFNNIPRNSSVDEVPGFTIFNTTSGNYIHHYFTEKLKNTSKLFHAFEMNDSIYLYWEGFLQGIISDPTSHPQNLTYSREKDLLWMEYVETAGEIPNGTVFFFTDDLDESIISVIKVDMDLGYEISPVIDYSKRPDSFLNDFVNCIDSEGNIHLLYLDSLYGRDVQLRYSKIGTDGTVLVGPKILRKRIRTEDLGAAIDENDVIHVVGDKNYFKIDKFGNTIGENIILHDHKTRMSCG